MKRKIVCIVGATATGKTALAIRLAEQLGGEIVSADSVQVYRKLDIGSAKSTSEELQRVTHHMIDCCDPDDADFSVGRYRDGACNAICSILDRGRIPIVAGGSGLYINSLVFPLNFAVPSDPKIREELYSRFDEHRSADAWRELDSCDPITASRLHPNDLKRILRALEVYQCSGQPLSSFGNDFQNSRGDETEFEPLLIGLSCIDRKLLYDRIDRRVDLMMAQGLYEEVFSLYKAYGGRHYPAFQSIGYRQLFDHFDGLSTREEAVSLIKRDSRRFAKRQISWFKRDTRIRWFPFDTPANQLDRACIQLIKDFYEDSNVQRDDDQTV